MRGAGLPGRMASTGQRGTQSPQPVQSSLDMR